MSIFTTPVVSQHLGEFKKEGGKSPPGYQKGYLEDGQTAEAEKQGIDGIGKDELIKEYGQVEVSEE